VHVDANVIAGNRPARARIATRLAGPTLAPSGGLAIWCPSDYFNAWYRTDGPQNYSFWHNAEFDKLVDQIDVEVDTGKRMALIRQAEDIMEQDPPLVPVAWENILDVWYNYVKGHNPKDYFGIYDVVRFDTFWLDKA